MKKSMLALALSGALATTAAVQAQPLETEQQKLSYSLGLILGERIQADVETLDVEAFSQGVEAVFSGQEPALDQQQVAEVMQAFQQRKMEEQRQAMAKLAEENGAKGAAYMAKNGAREGVVTTDSGLQYEVLTAGQGKSPKATDTVKVHYRGQLIDGTEFDSSYARNEPVSFPLDGVIPGWTEGLQLMQEGGKSRLVIPADLAYGPGGMGNAIGPNETLVFEVELLEVNPADSE
ncbi:MAG: FKBP-type peptidyl-prolyl cis-trans isomerase [Pseudomonadota bacterium]|nr:FKBP-type peptidyl-prolyl cis-trans isomerase [Pseudomonadota bacterium]